MSLTFISPSYHRESYLPALTHSPTFLLPQACLLGMSRLTSIGGSMKPKPAGSSWERTQGSAIVYRVLSAVHTKIFIIPLNCLVAFKKKNVFFFKHPLFPDCLRDTKNRILDTSNSGTSPLTRTVVPDPKECRLRISTVSWECPGLAAKLPALISLSSSQCSRVLKHRN